MVYTSYCFCCACQCAVNGFHCKDFNFLLPHAMNSKHTAEHTCILLAFLKELTSSQPYVSSIMHGHIVSVYQTIQPITMV